MQLLMTEIVRALVDEPAAVQLEVIVENEVTVLRLAWRQMTLAK
jgi:predicted RNA-binding protein YlqC (UPF0109 family)